jgi:hypothetical protein
MIRKSDPDLFKQVTLDEKKSHWSNELAGPGRKRWQR